MQAGIHTRKVEKVKKHMAYPIVAEYSSKNGHTWPTYIESDGTISGGCMIDDSAGRSYDTMAGCILSHTYWQKNGITCDKLRGTKGKYASRRNNAESHCMRRAVYGAFASAYVASRLERCMQELRDTLVPVPPYDVLTSAV